MNQSLKWKNNYIFLEEMVSVLDRMYEDIKFSVSKDFL